MVPKKSYIIVGFAFELKANNQTKNKIGKKYDNSYKLLIFTRVKFLRFVNNFLIMHEMSIALNIIQIAETELQKSEGKEIIAMNISVGKLSGVVIESLYFALKTAKEKGPLSQAKINIDEMPAKMKCLSCMHEFEVDEFYNICPKCESFKHEILSGKELLINSITIQ